MNVLEKKFSGDFFKKKKRSKFSISGPRNGPISKVRSLSCGAGVPQPAEGPHDGGPGHRAAGHGHPDPGRAGPHGGRPPDVDALDSQDNRGGGTHRAAAGPHTASHCAALQGERMCSGKNELQFVTSAPPSSTIFFPCLRMIIVEYHNLVLILW